MYISDIIVFASVIKRTIVKIITKRLTNEEKDKYKLEGYLRVILIGNILGDAHMKKSNISINSKANASVRFLQSVAQAEFIYHLYDLFKDFCASPPKKSSSLIKETGKIIHSIYFATRNLPYFYDLYSLFNNNRIKIIPSIFEDLLTPVNLAYWIMGDGSWIRYGLKLHTNNFSKEEVILLIKAINTKFNLNSLINVTDELKSQYTIYIPSKKIALLKSLVLPYFIPCFLKINYKLNIK